MISLSTLMVLAQVGSGRIQGGWGYVWACYGLTLATLLLYTLSLWVRRPRTPQASQDAKE